MSFRSPRLTSMCDRLLPKHRLSIATAVLVGVALCGVIRAQELSEPVYRVAEDTAAQPVSSRSDEARTGAAAERPPLASPFDLAQRPGEHPLMPLIRTCKASLEHLDKNIRDYSCTLQKQERLDGELAEQQNIYLKVRHEPFSVYMSFIKPHAGREVLWVDGQNENDLIVREAGFIGGALGKLSLNPEGSRAMDGQKYPIYKVGIRNLLLEIIKVSEADTKFAESDVTIDPRSKIFNRPATLIQVVHPVPRQNFRAHVIRVFFDHEYRVPIYYDAFLWPEKDGERPPLDESYAYRNLKLNNGYSARDFDAENGEIFK